MVKARGSSRFRGARLTLGVVGVLAILLVAAILAALLIYGDDGASRVDAPAQRPSAAAPGRSAPPIPSSGCTARAYAAAARANARNLASLPVTPFGRLETGWRIYAPLTAREIGTTCSPITEGFAAALARWQGGNGVPATGIVDASTLAALKAAWQERRTFVRLSARGVCPAPPASAALGQAALAEGYGGKAVELRRGALEAYRRMRAAAHREAPAIAADPRNLTIFSGYRSPAYDAARCARDGNCDGRVRARCSPHRTGLAMDLYVGQAPGFGPDSTADANRLAQSRSPAYRWLVANGHRFGFVNYPFEPWHWEWTGETP